MIEYGGLLRPTGVLISKIQISIFLRYKIQNGFLIEYKFSSFDILIKTVVITVFTEGRQSVFWNSNGSKGHRLKWFRCCCFLWLFYYMVLNFTRKGCFKNSKIKFFQRRKYKNLGFGEYRYIKFR